MKDWILKVTVNNVAMMKDWILTGDSKYCSYDEGLDTYQ